MCVTLQQLSQFWYDDRTAEYLAKEAFAACGKNGKYVYFIYLLIGTCSVIQ